MQIPEDDREMFDNLVTAFKMMKLEYEAALMAGWTRAEAMELVSALFNNMKQGGAK